MPHQNATPGYIELRFIDGGIAARYDPARGILEVQRRGQKHYFDLAQLSATQFTQTTCNCTTIMLESKT